MTKAKEKKSWKVNVTYTPITEEEMKRKRELVAKILATHINKKAAKSENPL
jgi:hypothetical protein